MTDHLSVFEISNKDEFATLRREWHALVERAEHATIFQTWEFQYHIWHIYADRVSLCLVLARDSSGVLVGCAPLGTRVWRVGPVAVRILEFASGRYCDYANFIVDRDHTEVVLAAFAKWFRHNLNRWDVVRLLPIREDFSLSRTDLFLSKIGYPSRISPWNVAPYLRFQTGWSTFEDVLGNKRAGAMRYKVRKLLRRIEGSYDQAEGHALDEAVTQLMDLHQRRMRTKYQVGAFADPSTRDGFRVLMQELAQRGLAKVHTVSATEQTIAAICTFEFQGVVSYYQGGFDPAYQNLSPGMVLHALRINEAIKDGAVEYDFLDGDEAYKFTWANGQRRLYAIDVITGSRRARPYYWWHQARMRLAQSDRARALYVWLGQRLLQPRDSREDHGKAGGE